jgi:hypothetical protein
MADINRMMRGSIAIYCEAPKAVADDISYMLRTGAEEIETLRVRVARLERALREIRDYDSYEADKSKNILVYLNGKDKPAFRCHCGCNVFHHPTDISEEESRQTYICNACDTRYIGE